MTIHYNGLKYHTNVCSTLNFLGARIRSRRPTPTVFRIISFRSLSKLHEREISGISKKHDFEPQNGVCYFFSCSAHGKCICYMESTYANVFHPELVWRAHARAR